MTDEMIAAEYREEINFLRERLADVIHSNSILQGAIESVCSGARSLAELREWHEGPRTKGDGLYSWRDERRDLLKRIHNFETRCVSKCGAE